MITLVNLLQVVLIVLGAPLVRGLVAVVKARLQHRRGASVWRPYQDLGKLWRKEDLVAPSASWLFHACPRILFCATVGTALLAPVLHPEALLGGPGDIILLVLLLALARFFLVLGAMDGGGAFGGMGASREVLVAALAEAPLLLALAAPGIRARSFHLAGIVKWTLAQSFFDISAVHLLAFFALAMVVLAETGRIPVDNPTAHLELTMIHEATVLEYSGPSLAFLEWAHAVKLSVFLSLLIGLFFPWGMAASGMAGGMAGGAVCLAFLAHAGKIAALAVVLALVESSMAKMRMYAVPDFLGVASALGVMAVVFTVIGRR